MAKKSKDPTNSSMAENTTTPNNIFNKLFGDDNVVEEATNSLFSSDNPFRRKPTEIPPNSSNPRNFDIDKPNLKRNKDQIDVSGDKKLKKEKKLGENNPNFERLKKGKELGENPNLENLGENPKFEKLKKGGKLGENPNLEKLGGNPNLEKLGEKISNLEIDKKDKKKRKRDELEREYEIKKYGSVVEEENDGEEKKEKSKKRKEIENVKDMVVTEEGYDDESKLLRTIFVGTLPLKVKKKVLIKEFSKFGEIDSVRIRSVPTLDSKKPKKIQVISGKINEQADSVNAYIVFKTEQGAEASLAHNMSVVGGNHIRVDRACPPRKKMKTDDASATLYNNKRTVFVGNLPFDVKDEELYRLFCGIKQLESSVEAVRVIRDRETSLGKGIAYVMFKTREAANIVCGKHNLKLRDRELRISIVKTGTSQSSTPSKRKGPFRGDSEAPPAKKSPIGAKTPESRYKVNARGDTSYQGLRASKSGEKKKTPQRRSMTPASVNSGMKKKRSGDKIKQRSEKRPAVAARKAKAKGLQSVGVSNQTGKKRKMDTRTPQSSSKKSKKLK